MLQTRTIDASSFTNAAQGRATVLPIQQRVPWWAHPALILFVAAFVRLIALLFIEGEVNDGVTRIGTAARWFFAGVPTFGHTVWGEGNYVLPGLALLVWRDPYWSVRILYALLAVTNVWLALTVTRAAFDARAAAVTGWVVALMPFHLLMSANGATSEVPYISLILASVWAVMRYRRDPELRWAVIAGVLLALATTFRYDGVIWGLPLAASFVLWRPDEERQLHVDARTILHLAAFGVCGLLYVAAVFWRWSTLYASPWYPLDQAKLNTLQFFVNGHHPRWPDWFYRTYVVLFWPASMFAILTPGLALIGWLGLGVSATRGRRTAVPLMLGIAVAVGWLAYATVTHSILAQFRYAMILAIVVATFIVPGVRALRHRYPRLETAHITAAILVTGVAWQGLVTDASLHARGVLTNQLGSISPVQRSPFAARDLLAWATLHTTRERPLVVTPHVQSASAYYALKSEPLIQEQRVINQQYYLPNSQYVHTRASLTDALAQRIAAAGWVATTTATRQLGLRDGLQGELVVPARVGATYAWYGIALTPVARWGDIRLWRVDHTATDRAPRPNTHTFITAKFATVIAAVTASHASVVCIRMPETATSNASELMNRPPTCAATKRANCARPEPLARNVQLRFRKKLRTAPTAYPTAWAIAVPPTLRESVGCNAWKTIKVAAVLPPPTMTKRMNVRT